MSFYSQHENMLSKYFISLDQETSDMDFNLNENSELLLTTLNEFFELDNLSNELVKTLTFEINQRLLWENVLEYSVYDQRKTFNFDDFKDDYVYNVPDDYLGLQESDSIITSTINILQNYLKEKYDSFHFERMDEILNRMEIFTAFNYIYKLFHIFECYLPNALKESKDETLELFPDIKIQEINDKLKDEKIIGLIWNQTFNNYLSKCDKNIYEIFELQRWPFITAYVIKNIR
jgi:hypothetical protein